MNDKSDINNVIRHLREKKKIHRKIEKMRSILGAWVGEDEANRQVISYMPISVRVGDVINNILNSVSKEDGNLLDSIRHHWSSLTGNEISSNSKPTSIRDRLLYVEAKNNIWVSELKNFYGKLIEEKVKAFCGDSVLKIIFVPPNK